MPRTPAKTLKRRAELSEQVIRTARALEAGDGKRSDLLRRLAELIVQLRSQYEFDGHTDWAGRGGGYRDAISQAYRTAGIPQATVDGLQAALRYHIGNVVREVAPPEELAAAGLDPAGPLGRLQRRRQTARQEKQEARQQAAIEAVEHGDAITLPLIKEGGHRRRPRLGLAGLEDPAALVGFALDAIQAAKELDPRGEMAEDLQPMLRRLNDEVFDLHAMVRARATRGAKRR